MSKRKALASAAAAAISAVLASATVSQAAEDVVPNVTIVPSARIIPYSLVAGAVTPDIVIPAGVPVQMVGVQTRVGFRGVGQASLLSIAGAGGFIQWVGLDSTSGAAITQGFSGVAGTKILFIDFSHCVQVEVAGAAGSSRIRVNNKCSSGRTGSLLLTW